MFTKTSYDMPYPEVVPTTMDEVKDYIDTMAAWIAEKLGLVVREDLTADAPDYGQYSYFKYLAEDANSDPYLAVYNPNLSSSIRFSGIVISPVKKVTNYFMPVVVDGNVSSNPSNPNRTQTGIILNYSNLGNTYKFSLLVVDCNDGRKVAIFKSFRVWDGSLVSKYSESFIYIGNIRMRGFLKRTCVVFSACPNSSWIEEYEQCASSTAILQSAGLLYSNGYYNQLNGILPSSNSGKEFLVDINYYIGEDAYFVDFKEYSDTQKQLNTGSIISINNKKYLCIYQPSQYLACFVIPEEVS